MTTQNANIGYQLLEKARNYGDQASIQALYRRYEETFKKAAMVHFKKTPFDFEVAWLPNSDRRKQGVVFSAAYDAFVDAYRTYDDSCDASFETWLSNKIGWHFADLQRKAARYGQRMVRYGEEREISEGGSVLYQNKKYRPQSDIDNDSRGARGAYDVCDTDLVNEVLRSMPEKGAARKNAEALYRIFSEEGTDRQNSVAERLGISRQAISKSFKSYREYGPKAIREKVLEKLRQNASRSSYAKKSAKCGGTCG